MYQQIVIKIAQQSYTGSHSQDSRIKNKVCWKDFTQPSLDFARKSTREYLTRYCLCHHMELVDGGPCTETLPFGKPH